MLYIKKREGFAQPRLTAILGIQRDSNMEAVIRVPNSKNQFNIEWRIIIHISDIKLKRTDTTLDLSQEAQEDCNLLKWKMIIIYNFWIALQFLWV